MASRNLTIAVGLPLLIMALGRFLPGPAAWGFNHLAYLSPAAYGAWLAATAIVLALPWRRVSERLGNGSLGRFLDEHPIVIATLAGFIAWLFRERTSLYGDGYLITEMVARGDRVRVFDNMDYFLHALIYRWMHALGSQVSAAQIYVWGAVLGAFFGTLLLAHLLGRLEWERPRRWLVLGLFLLGPSALLFVGHVESYTWLYVASSSFLVTGLMVLQGRAPLWIASTAFGLALFFHLTAAFAVPAMLFLLSRSEPRRHRWAHAIGPPLGILGLAAAVHTLAGHGLRDVSNHFSTTGIARGMWVPMTGDHGVLSVAHWKDQLNLILFLSAVPAALVLWQLRNLRREVRDPRIQFIVVHILSILGFSLFIDRQLGGARDWDLLAGQWFGLSLLAALLWPPNSRGLVALALCATGLGSAPWVVLQHGEASAVQRFLDVAEDYDDYTRAYAYEEVGKLYRSTGAYDRAAEMFKRSIAAFPSSRFHLQLGSVYLATAGRDGPRALALAENELREAVRIDPRNAAASSLLADLLLADGRSVESAARFRDLVAAEPTSPAHWAGLGYSELENGDFASAERAFRKLLELQPDAHARSGLTTALMSLGRFSDAADLIAEAIARGDDAPDLERTLAACRVYEVEQLFQSGVTPDPNRLSVAVASVRQLLELDPGDSVSQALAERLRRLVWSDNAE